ncbi:LOW QUALITY PROTEIN: peroxiredoxin-2E-2, chloroplastic-like [Zea mays]|uniref:LOW QUALITY PROTEIN: peroxiredoxin-2E-2, chloroplastic-like n=1 Tax=Zea mays TaxID=4577 RepID=UPI000C6C4A37|nr:LOW QUALITY PROTEIN: peroxiredoxin-2E-2, chloroplastic-like [Zea mays]|eukprot:XP_023156448.1 LOW QUALITY PROTEIN: peroxiredoxin-2E-2, chloroplastic-like [Zea mays]
MATTTTAVASLTTLSPAVGKRFVLSSPCLSFSSHRLTIAGLRHRYHTAAASRTARRRAASTSLVVGSRTVTLPDAMLSYFDPADGELRTVTVAELTAGKKVILFAVPGAFTPTCSQKHLPGFMEKAGELKAKGVDTVACVSVNDAFVMKAWKELLGLADGSGVLLLSDGNLELTRALGVEMDLSDKPIGLGVRSRRYALLAEDGVVKVLNLEEDDAFTTSSAEEMLRLACSDAVAAERAITCGFCGLHAVAVAQVGDAKRLACSDPGACDVG